MDLYRYVNPKYPPFDGGGAKKSAGRCHAAGTPTVYFSESPALAVLEVMVHESFVPPSTLGFELHKVSISASEPFVDLTDEGIAEEYLQLLHLGRYEVFDAFLQAEFLQPREAATIEKLSKGFMKVPSVRLPDSYNYVLHADRLAGLFKAGKASSEKLEGESELSFLNS